MMPGQILGIFVGQGLAFFTFLPGQVIAIFTSNSIQLFSLLRSGQPIVIFVLAP